MSNWMEQRLQSHLAREQARKLIKRIYNANSGGCCWSGRLYGGVFPDTRDADTVRANACSTRGACAELVALDPTPEVLKRALGEFWGNILADERQHRESEKNFRIEVQYREECGLLDVDEFIRLTGISRRKWRRTKSGYRHRVADRTVDIDHFFVELGAIGFSERRELDKAGPDKVARFLYPLGGQQISLSDKNFTALGGLIT